MSGASQLLFIGRDTGVHTGQKNCYLVKRSCATHNEVDAYTLQHFTGRFGFGRVSAGVGGKKMGTGMGSPSMKLNRSFERTPSRQVEVEPNNRSRRECAAQLDQR